MIDASYVIRGFKKGPDHVPELNGDLWRLLWNAYKERQGRLHLKKIKSHMSLTEGIAA